MTYIGSDNEMDFEYNGASFHASKLVEGWKAIITISMNGICVGRLWFDLITRKTESEILDESNKYLITYLHNSLIYLMDKNGLTP